MVAEGTSVVVDQDSRVFASPYVDLDIAGVRCGRCLWPPQSYCGLITALRIQFPRSSMSGVKVGQVWGGGQFISNFLSCAGVLGDVDHSVGESRQVD
jgi:hypothetical protein